ncbi:zinc finger protein 638 [Pleuronectes platessa]|uniref:zinc finger protein 638 n=1 Tax=Pleuronectes platessa TaxID=8262 RepID=UPI00232A690F|nr:zinc finger protein 638 [Pleuronectes platessa]
MELGETGGDVVETCAEGKETNVEAYKPSGSQPPTSKDETGPPTVQTADEASSQVPEPESTEPESTERSVASGLDTKMEASRSPSPTEEGEKNTKDPASAEKNHRDPASASVSTEPAAGTGSEKPAAAGRRSSAAVRTLTIGEMVEEHFHPDKIKCLSKESAMSKESCRTLLISNLPKFHEGCYTEDDVAAVFVPFGLTSWSEEIYVVPQARVAFVVMPSPLSIHRVLAARPDSIAIKKNRLSLQVLGPKDNQSLKDPFWFYTSLMKWMDSRMEHDGHKTVYIRNISPSEARDLREALRKIGSVSNYLPLLNKVFIEFESDWGADRLGMWCSLLKQAQSYIVVRLKEPFSTCRAQTPEHPEKAIPHSKDAAAWATTPSQKHGVPRGSCSPFWITMSTSPFVFPTTSPWFSIPEYQTVRGYDDIKNDHSRGSMFLTLMLTGLPEGGYRQEDVYRLVRPYFPQILDSLYYNVIVLTLQRRAFVHFSDWTSCCNFVRDHIREPVSVRGSVLKIHFVLEYMYPESREELMYTSLMKWSNSSVPDPQSLEERLLCVDIAQTSVYLIKTVMKTVASIAKFVSFLPLANRICVEMADSSGAAQVLEKFMVFTPKAQCERLMFQKVTGIRSLKSSKKHIEASAEPAGDIPMEEVEKLGAEMVTDSTSAPKADEDVDAADGDTVPAASGPTFSTTSLPRSNETTTEHPPIDQDTITAVLAAVRQHRLAQERTQRGETESSLRSQNQDEATDVVLTSDDQPLNLRDFVTVDEVGDDVEETNPAHEASRGQRDAKKRKRSNKPSKATEQETSEILIIDNQTTMDQNTEEEDASKEVDSVTDQPTTTESESDNKKPDVTSRRDDRSSKRSGLRTRASKSEEKVKSPEKQDRVVKRSEAPRDSTARLPQRDQDPEEEKVSEMVHSTEELVQEAAATERTDRRSGRGKKEEKVTLNLTEASEKPDEDEEASYEILDSVEDETVTEEPVVMTRSTRGRRGRTTQKDQTKKEDTPTRSRRTPVRETQEKTLEMEKEASSKENSPTKKKDITVREEIDEEATYEILDSVEDEVLQDDRPPTGGKRKRGRPKKAVKSTRKKPVTLKGDKDASEKEADDEKVSSPILDSVKDEMVEDQPPTEESLKDKEEEPVHQIVDSLEDDPVKEELMTTEESKDETCPKEEEAAVQEDAPTCSTIVLEASEKVVAENLESGNDPSAAEESGVDKKERSLRTDIKEEDTSTTKSQGDAATPAEEKNQQSSGESDTIVVKSALLNLDEVRDEKDDHPEDTAEAEGLRERQAGAKEQERNTRETDGREQEVVDSTELVTLDEVGADEAGEETVEIRAGELQGLVTLDEIIDADEGEVEQSTLEPRPPIKEDQAVETLDEAGDDEEGNTDEAEKTTRPVKSRINEDTEETLVTVDEVEEEEKKEAPRTRGRPKKRSRKTPVRKSARGKKVVEQAESGSDAPPPTSLDASSSLDKDPSTLSSDSQQEIQKASLEGAGHSDIDAASAGQDLQPEAPENQRLEGEEAMEASSVPSKRKREPVGPEAKRSRSLSPSVSTDIKLPPFSPSNPLGPEFLVPKLGYFCNLCHVFCVHESSARDTHCSSQTHYDNLQKHYEKLQPEPSKGSTGNSQASFSD